MRHYIKKYINAEGVGAFFGEFVEEVGLFTFAFPAVAVVAVVGRDDHDLVFIIEKSANVHVLAGFAAAVFARMGFPGHASVLGAYAVVVARGLEFVFWNLKVEDAVEDRMLHGQLDKVLFGEDSFHLSGEGLPLPFAPEV